MKKLLYSLAVAFAGIAALTGCTTFDDEHSEHYGEGPAVAINLTETKDNSPSIRLKAPTIMPTPLLRATKPRT